MKASRVESGAATVLAAVLATFLVTMALVAGAVVALVVTHRTAQAAADLAALAGADAIQAGRDGCSAAAGIAQANGASVVQCRVAGPVLALAVVVRAPEVLGGRELRARARAGPVGP